MTNIKSSLDPQAKFPFKKDLEAIGVFDSGLGGLTVLKSLIEAYPGENFIYLGDTARLPYGSKSPETIRHYAEQIMSFLVQIAKLKAIVVACNSASTQVPESSWQGIPVFNVIDPGVALALKSTQTGRIGVLATRATVASDEYAKRLRHLSPGIHVVSGPAPLLVPLAEEGWVDDPITNLVVYRYVQPLLREQIDTLILGCTHYPILENSLRKAAGSGVQLIHSGPAIAEALKPLTQVGHGKGQIHLMTTDFSATVKAQAERLLHPLQVDSIFWV